MDLTIGSPSTSVAWVTGAGRGLHTLSPSAAGLGETGTTPPDIRSAALSSNKLYTEITAADAFTFEAWVTPSAAIQPVTSDGYSQTPRRIIAFGNVSTDNALISHCSTNNVAGTSVLWRPRNTRASGVYAPGNTLSTSLTHIVGTKAAGDANYRIYINGVEVTTTGIAQDALLSGWVASDRLCIANRNHTNAITSRP
jgi:hypothetical protein